MGRVKEFFLDVSGASSLEYALLITFIAVVIIWGVSSLGLVTRANLADSAALFP